MDSLLRLLDSKAIQNLLSPALGMFVGGLALVAVGLPAVYEERYATLNTTIQIVKEQNELLIEENKKLRKEVHDLTVQVGRLSGGYFVGEQ